MLSALSAREVRRAWWTAALVRADRLPELGPLLERVSAGGDPEQSPEEQMRAARAIAAAFANLPTAGGPE